MNAGVYIDDSGTPGVKSPSAFLHLKRKSWAAVIVPEGRAKDVHMAMRIFLEGIKKDYNADELHFTDIYGGRETFQGISIEDRYQLIELTVSIFKSFQIPVFYQTLSPEFMRELKARGFPAVGRVGFLDLANHEHLALLSLLIQVKNFILANRKYIPREIPVFVDEGMKKSGTTLTIPSYRGVYEGGEIRYAKSHENPFLQLADFAAFAIGRTQWLLGQGKLKDRDRRFLQIVSPLHECIMNLPKFHINLDKLTTEIYDAMLIADRRAKGLPDYP